MECEARVRRGGRLSVCVELALALRGTHAQSGGREGVSADHHPIKQHWIGGGEERVGQTGSRNGRRRAAPSPAPTHPAARSEHRVSARVGGAGWARYSGQALPVPLPDHPQSSLHCPWPTRCASNAKRTRPTTTHNHLHHPRTPPGWTTTACAWRAHRRCAGGAARARWC